MIQNNEGNDLELNSLMKLKSTETTGNLGQDVREGIGHRYLSGSSHHNSHCRVEVTTGNMATKHNCNGQSGTNRNRVTSCDDDIQKKHSSKELYQILIQH